MALKKAHKEMLKGAGVTFGFAVLAKGQFDQWVAYVSRMFGRG